MRLKKLYIMAQVTLCAGLAPLLAACALVIGPDSLPASPAAGPGATSSRPAPTPTPAPLLQPAVPAVVQQRMAEILTPSRRSEARSMAHPYAGPAGPGTPAVDYQEQYYRSGFACTGSMRPSIDCGDEGVFLKPPFPGPLMVGDVISFTLDASCPQYQNHDISKAHRIVSVRFEDGTSYYTTRGDAALNPDSCEVTPERIDGKLVELHQGVRPQDIIDVSEYDYAKVRLLELKELYQGKRAGYDRRLAEFAAEGEEYQRLLAAHQRGEASYDQVVEFHREREMERVDLGRLIEELNSLGEEINAAADDMDRIYRRLFIR